MQPKRLHPRQHKNCGSVKKAQRECRVLTTVIKTLLRCLAALDKFDWRWPNEGDHQCKVLEWVMAAFAVEDISKEMFSFEEVPNLTIISDGTP